MLFGAALLPAIVLAQNIADRSLFRLQRDDRNGDGKVTQAEFTGPDRLFRQLDSDGDGVLIVKGAAAKLKELMNARRGPAQKQGGTKSAEKEVPPATGRKRSQDRRAQGRSRIRPDDENVSYGKHERHVFDVYQAESDGQKPLPCMIWIHGGGFRRGDKNEGSLFSGFFIQNGIHYVTLNYRLSQQATAPACFEDCARALQFIRRHAERWNIDPGRIAVGGGSAGAGLAQWLAFSEDKADPATKDPVLRESTRVSAAILLNAQTTYDFRWIRQHIPGDAWKGDGIQELFGYDVEKVDAITADKYRLIESCSPINHFSKGDPPVLFYYRRSRDPKIAEKNAMDGIHHPIFGLELKKLANHSGTECEVFTVENEEDLAFYNNRWNHAVVFLKRQFGLK
jgi:acetyl esterase/lipase